MAILTLVNGVATDTVSVHDRGLMYGDGVFRTMLLHDGTIQHWPLHYFKLCEDCLALNLVCPSETTLLTDLDSMVQGRGSWVVRITITRGLAPRGYAVTESLPSRVLSLSSVADYPDSFSVSGVRLHICNLRLSHQPRLAGIKHLNRLENVLAASEWSDPDFPEGLLLDEAGYVIGGVRSNIFMVKHGELITPDLSQCGVSGVQRKRILTWAQDNGIPCQIKKIPMNDFVQAEEIFLVNSVIGLWPVREMPGYVCGHHPISKMIQEWL